MDSNKIPAEFFFRHVEKVQHLWPTKGADMDSLLIVNGKGPGNERTVGVVGWFFAGFNLADTIFAMSRNRVIIFASERKINFLANLKEDPGAEKFNLTLVAKTEDTQATFSNIWNELHRDVPSPKVGMLLDDTKNGLIAEDFMKFVEGRSHSPVELFPFFNECFTVKDAEEINNLRRSSKVSAYFFQKFIKEVELVIDSGRATKHSTLSKKVLDLMESESELKKCQIKLASQKVGKDYIDFGAPIAVQSGGNYSNRLFIESDDRQLRSDCIVVSLGSMYRSYNSFISRTLLIDPSQEQKAVYKKIETLIKVITQNLRVGVKISDVYKKARQFILDTLPVVDPPASFGHGMGILLSENTLAINENNDRAIEQGNCFLVTCHLPEIKVESKKSKSFAIQICDIVVVEEKGQEVMTSEISKSLSEISYSLEDEDEVKRKPAPKMSSNIIEGSRRRVQEVTAQKLQNQKERNQHQIILKRQKLEELKERSAGENFNGSFKKQKTIECSKIECYKSQNELPRDLKPNLIYIDNKNNSILLPINGKHVPFHVCILKSVVKNEEGNFASLRFNFHLPGGVATINFPKYPEPTVFVKEMYFRSQNKGRVFELEKQLKALQKKFRLEISEKHAKEDIVEQEKININKGKRPILRDLFARPTLGQKKVKGSLECHLNGFRYSNSKGDVIDVPFSNVKFAFFQPCEKQIIAAVHFKLHEPIMVGKKKTDDIQFYSEGGVAAEDVVGKGRNDDSDDEERQREVKRRIDRDFLHWAKACDEFTNKAFEFEVPNRPEGFYGTTYRSNVLLQPTKTCLINITEPQFFVFPIEDIEVVWFQRMTGNVRYFDLTIVHKDYEKHIRISSISIKDVERVKDWLDRQNVIFYDNKVSVNWAKFLAGCRQDFKQFVETGAWTAWDQADEEEDEDAEGDSEFSASSDDFDEDSESDDDSESDFEGDSEDDSDGSEDLSEEGLSWDEMEEKAERQDREKIKRELEKEKEKGVVRKKR